MLNEKLFDNKKHAKIACLSQEIKAFKEYYKKESIRLGKIEKILDSMKSKDPKIKNLKIEILELKAKIGEE